MMTTVVERVGSEARSIRVGHVVLVAIAGVFYAMGWTARKLCLALAWIFAAIKVGWIEAASK